MEPLEFSEGSWRAAGALLEVSGAAPGGLRGQCWEPFCFMVGSCLGVFWTPDRLPAWLLFVTVFYLFLVRVWSELRALRVVRDTRAHAEFIIKAMGIS